VSSGRPRVVANCAVSVDGRLAFAGGVRARLSGPEDLRRVHQMRADSDAIAVGVGTVVADDPSLRVHWELLDRPAGRPPLRVILDTKGRTPPGARVLDGSIATLVATGRECPRRFPPSVATFAAGEREVDLPALLGYLARRGVRQLMVEGGAAVLASFLRGGLVDELTVYVAPCLIGGRTAPPMLAGPETPGPGELLALTRIAVAPLGEGVLVTYRPARGPGAPL